MLFSISGLVKFPLSDVATILIDFLFDKVPEVRILSTHVECMWIVFSDVSFNLEVASWLLNAKLNVGLIVSDSFSLSILARLTKTVLFFSSTLELFHIVFNKLMTFIIEIVFGPWKTSWNSRDVSMSLK